jgi:glycosyltransferase involved in cell wall biosynthesis
MKKTLIISGQFTSLSGYGKKSYDIAKSFINLYSQEYEISLLPLKWGNTKNDAIDESDEIFKYFIPQIQFQPNIYIHIGLPNEFQKLALEKNILFTSGIETNIAPKSFIEGCNRADLVIVPSTFVKKILEETLAQVKDNNGNIVHVDKVKVPIEVLFEGYDENIFKQVSYKDNKLNLKSIKEDFAFLFVGTWLDGEIGQDRKDVGMLVKVFYETFKNKLNSPCLILKTSGATTSIVDRDKIQNKIDLIKSTVDSKILPNVYLIHGDLEDVEMNMLYNNSKIKAMVSLTKGEGFSRTFLEFATTSKPLIVSGYSGHMDFLKQEYNIFVGGKLTDVHPSAVNDFILKESKWFTANYNDAANILNEVYKNYKKYLELSKKQNTFVSTTFTRTKMQEKLQEIFENNVPKTVELKIPDFIKLKQK